MIDLTLVTDAENEPITVSETKDYLRIDSDISTDDDLIAVMIKSARFVVEKICGGLCVLPQVWLQSQDFGGTSIDFYRQPVTDVSYVVEIDASGVRTTLTKTDDYYYTKSELLPENSVFSGGRPGEAYELQYTAGRFTSTTSVSSDIKVAMLELVAFWYQNRDQYYELKVPKSVFPLLSGYRLAVSLL